MRPKIYKKTIGTNAPIYLKPQNNYQHNLNLHLRILNNMWMFELFHVIKLFLHGLFIISLQLHTPRANILFDIL